MHPTSQIIEKNLDRRKHCATGLWINPERDATWRGAASRCKSLRLCCQDHGAFRFHRAAGAEVQFSALPIANGTRYQWIILTLPRQKALLAMLLDCAANLLADDGVLWLAGENTAGIKSANKILKTHFAQVGKLDNARHCILYEARSRRQHQSFDASAYRQEWPLTCLDSQIRIVSWPGVFAHGRLDEGTALLLKSLAAVGTSGEVLDFGCGAGVIGACIAKSNADSKVTFLDSNAVALMSCEQTLSVNALSGSLVASDGLTELQHSFDMVVSNPPIHAGHKTDSRLSLRLLGSVNDHIKPGGSLLLVANRHLPYENWLRQDFRRVSELNSSDHFKVMLAES